MTMAKFGLQGGLDEFIRRRGVTQPLIVAVLRNHLLLLLVLILIGSFFSPDTLWGIWLAAGFGVMTVVLFSWARFFSRNPLTNFTTALLRAVLLQFLLRLVLLALALYACLVIGHADPLALLTGVAAGSLVPVLTWAFEKGIRH